MPPPQGSWNPAEGPGDFTTTKLVHSDTYSAISPLHADYTNRSVFIVGASKGIGRAIALSYARAKASQIAIGARSDLSSLADELIAAAKAANPTTSTTTTLRVLQVKLDVTSEDSVAEAASKIKEAFDDRLDVLVNVAGVLKSQELIGQDDVGDWWSNFTVNLRGPYLTTRACLPLLLNSTLKTLVNVSSVGAHLTMPRLSGYQTSKLAVVRLTEFVAVENAAQGLVAVVVHPGNVLTEIANHGEGMDEQLKAILTETPELCADSLVYLTRERREWLSGRYVNVCWDLPELLSDPKKQDIIDGDKLKVKLVL